MKVLVENPVGYFLVATDPEPNIIATYTFQNIDEAVESLKKIQHSEIPENLETFLQSQLNKNDNTAENSEQSSLLSVEDKITVGDNKFATNLSEKLTISAVFDFSLYREVLQSSLFADIRDKISKYVSVCHRIAHSKVDVSSTDLPITQLTSILNSLDEEVNSKTMRVKEWYGVHFPELDGFLNDNTLYLKAVISIGNRINFLETVGNAVQTLGISFYESLFTNESKNTINVLDKQKDPGSSASEINDQLEGEFKQSELLDQHSFSKNLSDGTSINPDLHFKNKEQVLDLKKSTNSFEALLIKLYEELKLSSSQLVSLLALCKISIGCDLNTTDLSQIITSTNSILTNIAYKIKLTHFLTQRMGILCPNACALIGPMLCAKIVAHFGSLKAVAQKPASTLQIVGAEKAYFNAIKNKGNTPKFGFIFSCDLIGNNNKGQAARTICAKLALCFRIDFYNKEEKSFGLKMREMLLKKNYVDKKTKPNKKTAKLKVKKDLEYDDKKDMAQPNTSKKFKKSD